MKNPFKIGDFVYKNYPFDGTPKAGFPNKSKVFRISKIEDHVPAEPGFEKEAICWLTVPCGDSFAGCSWSFYWNLSPVSNNQTATKPKTTK